jgi:hypothetical protein
MNYFEEQLNADQSMQELQQLIDSIDGWMDKNRYHTDRTQDRFAHVRTFLDDQHRNVLFLAEFSRGKTELINATVFGDERERMLPSSPGRTTRCTTVLQFEQSRLPSVRLLPTQADLNVQQRPVSMLLDDDSAWEHLLFSLNDPKVVKSSLKKITEAELVSPDEARRLGFLPGTEDKFLRDIDMIGGQVPIPKWRHAVVNYPHPLLKQGLRIVDTPGLNALGVEPELTLQALDSAHAVVFVLSADTGVTRSELKVWREHVKEEHTDHIIVVLNKIDLLWDELKSRVEIEQDIKKQIREVSRILEIPQDQIFPVSAQKAMVGRVQDDMRLVKSSGIQRYEQALADTINFSNQQRIVEQAVRELTPTMTAIRNVARRRLQDATIHAEELQSIHSNQENVMRASQKKIQGDVKRHARARDKVLQLKGELREGYAQFVRRLDLMFLDRMIASYRYEISNQLTTPGLQREMNDFHAVAVERFQMALSYIIRLEQKIGRVFREVEQTLNVKGLTARRVDPEIYIESLKKFQASHFKHSQGIGMLMTEQHVLRDRYHGSVMVKIRNLYKQTRDDVDRWCRTVLVPLELELKERATEIRRRHESLERVYRKDSQVQDEISDLDQQIQQLKQRITTLDHFASRLTECGTRNQRVPGNVITLHAPPVSRSA